MCIWPAPKSNRSELNTNMSNGTPIGMQGFVRIGIGTPGFGYRYGADPYQ